MHVDKIIEKEKERFSSANSANICDIRIERINKGANAKVYKIFNGDKKEIIKIYKKRTEKDRRDRQLNESIFLNYCKHIGITNTPRIININRKDSYTVMNYVKGSPPSSLGEREVDAIIEFLGKLNNSCYNKETKAFDKAAERCENPIEYSELLCKQVRDCQDKLAMSGLKYKNTIETLKYRLTNIISTQLNYIKEKNIIKAWNDEKLNGVISPSDVGIHNMLSTNDQINFIDFEYGGWDDVSKICADIILNPYHIKSNLDENDIIRRLSLHENRWGEMWIDRYYAINHFSQLNGA